MKIQIIIGSTRPGRVGPQIAEWLVSVLSHDNGAEYEIVDLVEWNLPFFDEPIHPMMEQYQHDHTKAWSQKIREADGFIILSPEYNAGYPAPLKNAIDFLYHEWIDKPVLIVSYGVHGGTSAAGQLRQIAERLKMRVTTDSPALNVDREMTDTDGQIKTIDEAFEPYKASVVQAGAQLLDELNNVESAVA